MKEREEEGKEGGGVGRRNGGGGERERGLKDVLQALIEAHSQ